MTKFKSSANLDDLVYVSYENIHQHNFEYFSTRVISQTYSGSQVNFYSLKLFGWRYSAITNILDNTKNEIIHLPCKIECFELSIRLT